MSFKQVKFISLLHPQMCVLGQMKLTHIVPLVVTGCCYPDAGSGEEEECKI